MTGRTTLADAVAAACSSLGDDGLFSADTTQSLRHVVAATDPADVPDHPADVFGAWEALSPVARTTLRHGIEDHVRRTMDRSVLAGPGAAAVRAARSFDRFLVDVGGSGALRRAAVTWSGRLLRGPRNLGNRLDRRAALRRWAGATRVGPMDLVARLGRDPSWLVADFARGIRVDPRARGYFHDRGRHVAWGYHLGLDLMVTDGGVVLIESNLEGGLVPSHLRDVVDFPLAERVTGFAASAGFRRLVWIEAERIPLYDYFLVDLVEWARVRGLTLHVFEDPCMPRRRALPRGIDEPNRWRPGLEVPNDTFVLRRNGYGVASDRVVTHKEPAARLLSARFRARGERRVRTFELTREPRNFEPASGPGLPNLVYKFPDGFAGQGVFFMRARDAEHARSMARELDRRHGEPPGLFQPFVRSRMVDGRAYHVRADLLVTPLGPEVVTMRRHVAGKVFREDVGEGVFPEKGVFATNLAGGGYLERCPADEAATIHAAVTAVGEAFIEGLSETFVTG